VTRDNDAGAPLRGVVIGVGNRYRSDDAAGLAVLAALREAHPPGVRLIEESGEGAALMEAWNLPELAARNAPVYIVDAVASGGIPGSIHTFDAAAHPVPSRFFHYSTHAFGVAEAIEVARSLGQLPPRLIVYGIEGGNFAAGEQLSPPVAQSVSVVAARILAEIDPADGG
jgi:hydrogenase maturation protease